ncbi:ISL3 family transposase [Streptosporangium sp. NPDC005286]|uniref:ISL3 family transposase n=1 Tax=Streptosporangium sp. NPDC005286 TaxID=3154463 RepID=UPI0033B173CC
MSITELLAVLFPHLAGVCIERVFPAGKTVRVRARSWESEAACPGCGVSSKRVHSRYDRRLSDRAMAGQEASIELRVRRFFCDNVVCGKRTFVEQVPGLTVRHGRRAAGLSDDLRAIALALGGRPGARLAEKLCSGVGRSTLLRLLRGLPDPQYPTPKVLGVDDFAWRRGHTYGTVLVNVETGSVVDLLPDRSAESFAAWLEAHPGVEVICRDRAGCYAEGGRRGAPLAVQVADRWHLLHNLSGAVERAVGRHRSHLREQPDAVEEPAFATPDLPTEEGPLAVQTRARHAEIHQALQRGMAITEISRDLRLDRKTVRRYLAVETADDLVGKERAKRQTILDTHLPYLREQWDQGCRNTDVLLEELRSRGFLGSKRTLRRLTAQLRASTAAATQPPAPKVREVTGWIVTRPEKNTAEDLAKLQRINDRCPELASVTTLTREFAEMLVQLRGKDLEAWTERAEASPARELRAFATGLRRDWAAVKAGLTLPHSSGTVEGNVNRIKMIKRVMFGRANPDLLRIRVLLGD